MQLPVTGAGMARKRHARQFVFDRGGAVGFEFGVVEGGFAVGFVGAEGEFGLQHLPVRFVADGVPVEFGAFGASGGGGTIVEGPFAKAVGEVEQDG